MKSIITLFISVLFLSSINAQVPKGMGKSDPAAKKVLDAVSSKFKTYKSVQANFSLAAVNSSGKSLGIKAGTVYMKGAKYRINFPGQEIYSDGSNVWTYDAASKEVTITKLDPSSNSLTPQKLFTNFYDKDFLYKLNDDVKVGKTSMTQVELTPVDKSKAFHKVLLNINNNSITSTTIYEKTGNRYTYSTTGLKPNGVIADNMFVYNVKGHPGVEVVDLR